VLRSRPNYHEVDDYEFFDDPHESWDVHFADVTWCREHFKDAGGRKPTLLPHQRINHFPNHHELTRKDLLAKNLKRQRKRFEKKGELEEAASYAFVPETFALPNDYELFAEAYRRGERAAVGDDKQSTYIAKPAGKAQGRGIFLFKKLSKLNPWRDANASARRAPKPFQRLGGHGSAVSHDNRVVDSNGSNEKDPLTAEPYVVQKYVANPLLIGGKKFDLRLYVLVTSVAPLKVFLHRSGFARFSTRRYTDQGDRNTAPLRDLHAHLTNVAVNKLAETYNKQNAQKWDLKSLRLHLSLKFGSDVIDKLFDSIQTLTIRSLLACSDKIIDNKSCFEIYGFDVLIDESLNPWLIEVNAAPSFTCDTFDDEKLKKKVISDALDVLDLERAVLESYGYFSDDEACDASKLHTGGFDLVWDGGVVVPDGLDEPAASRLGCFVQGA